MGSFTSASAGRVRGGLSKLLLNSYIVLFFSFLFLPLLFMMAASFNTSTIPSVLPWKQFTLDWFTVLFDDDLI